MKSPIAIKHVILLAFACTAVRVSAQNTWNLDGNFVAPGQFLGSTNFQAPVDLVAGGMRVLRLEPDSRTNVGGLSGNLIGGFINNVIEQPGSGGNFIGSGGFPAGPNVIRHHSQGVFIGAGSAHEIGPNVSDAAIVGGFGNAARSLRSFIGAGFGNVIDVRSFHSSIGAGFSNRIVGALSATIGGGDHNAIHTNASNSVIGGGFGNTIGTNSDFTVIAGGTSNQSESGARLSTISGGFLNTVQSGAFASTIGGGQQNTNAGQYSTLGGGFLNNSSSDFSAVGGGEQNISSGVWATVPGGFQNHASGQASLAAGALARANDNGSFVWAGGAVAPYPSVETNTFNVYGAAGAMFDYGGQNRAGRGNRWVHIGVLSKTSTISAWNGARLTDGGVWANASDKNRKTDFKDVDAGNVLERLAALPVREWRYTNEDAEVKHLGPTAQDFRDAFGFGNDDKSIGTVDADGVALAAIQGLNQKLESKLRQKEVEISEMKARLESLERLIGGSRPRSLSVEH